MPKETAKERKEREKAEQLALLHMQERQQHEINEEKGRQQCELVERVERLEHLVEFYQFLLDPASRLMVRRTEYEEIREIMQQDVARRSEEMRVLTENYLHMKDTFGSLQLELVHLRSECRQLHNHVKREGETMRTTVSTELQKCMERIESDILDHREDVVHCGTHLNRALEDARVRSAKLASSALTTAEKITCVLQTTHNGMHSRVPPRIRRELSRMEKDDLMLMLDTLSFDDGVLQYLQCRFPPAADNPFDDE